MPLTDESISKRNTVGSKFITPSSCPLSQCSPHLFMAEINNLHLPKPYQIQGPTQSFTSETAKDQRIRILYSKYSGIGVLPSYLQTISLWQSLNKYVISVYPVLSMKTRNQNRLTSRLEWVLPRSEVHVDLCRQWTGHMSHAGSFVEVRVGSCCSYCGKTGTWGNTEDTAGHFGQLVSHADQCGNCWCCNRDASGPPLI